MPLAALAAVQTGGYISPWKTLTVLVLLLVWARLLTWIDKDTYRARLPRELVNAIAISLLALAFLMFLLIPGFEFAVAIFVILMLGEVGAYVGLRWHRVGLADLRDQIRSAFERKAAKQGQKDEDVVGSVGKITLVNSGGTIVPVPEPESGAMHPYMAAQTLLMAPLKFKAERLDLTAGDPTVIAFLVDGVRYEADPMPTDDANAAVQFIKDIAGLDLDERRKPQTGRIRAALDNQRHNLQVTTFGSTAGESLRVLVDPQTRQNLKLDALGLSSEQLQIVRNLITQGGTVLMAAPRGHGLTSLAYAIIRAHDAFLYHVHTVERAPEMELEGITQNPLPVSPGPGEEATKVKWIVSQDPDVIMATLIEDPNSAVSLARWAMDQKRAYVGVRAGNAFDAIRQWRKLIGDDGLAIRDLRMVIAGRLIRRLCPACKVGYQPDPNQLRRLNMDPAVITKLYSARKEPMRDSRGRVVPCTFCSDLGFRGRFGVYEVLLIDDEIRQIVQSGGQENPLRQAIRKAQGRSVQELALQAVQEGETSVEEVLRVLRSDSPPSGQTPPGGRAGPAGPGRGGSGGPGGTGVGGPGASQLGLSNAPGQTRAGTKAVKP